MQLTPHTALTSFSARTNGFEPNQIWQDKVREEKKVEAEEHLFWNVNCYTAPGLPSWQSPVTKNTFLSLTLGTKKQRDYMVKLLHLRYYSANAVSF